MDSSEWTLVFFSVFSQMAAGMYILQVLILKSTAHKPSLFKTIFVILMPLLLISVLLSFFHLGNPSNAIQALNNLQSSWLSREVLFISLLTAISILQFFLLYRKKKLAFIFRIMNFAGFIIAFMFIFSMAKIYMLDAAPAWNSLYTPVEFFTCALLLGGTLLLMIIHSNNAEGESLRILLMRSNLLFILLFILIFFDLANAFYHHYIDFSEPLLNAAEVNYFPAVSRAILLIISLILLMFRFYIFRRKPLLSGFSAIGFIFFILLVAELTGRYIFYASHVSIGV